MAENYKSEDIAKIKTYLSAQPAEVSVADIVAQAGAEKLRVYPILCQMEQDGEIEVTRRDSWGEALTVRKK
jgi:DNA-binding IclR family transcriptional regulator